MGSHFNKDNQFQSDKYPTCPPGKVPLSVKDPLAQDLLWEYAERRRSVDGEFSDDLQKALIAVGFVHRYNLVPSVAVMVEQEQPPKHVVVCGDCFEAIGRGGACCERHRHKAFDPKELEGSVIHNPGLSSVVVNQPTCETCGTKMELRMRDRPGGAPGNGWGCPKCHPWPEKEK